LAFLKIKELRQLAERVAIIDLGSNSVRLIVMNIYKNGSYNLVYHQKEQVRLSEDIGEGKKAFLTPKAMKRAIDALNSFSYMCKLANADKILAVATAAIRSAKNGEEFLSMAKKETGISLRAIAGEEEAHFGYLGVINTIDIKDGLLFDLGGMSTEITLVRNRRITETVSLPIGTVNLTEKFNSEDYVTDNVLENMRYYIKAHIEKFLWIKDLSLPVVGIGGIARNIAKIDRRLKNYPFQKLHNYRLGKMAVTEIWKKLIKTNLSHRKKNGGVRSGTPGIIGG